MMAKSIDVDEAMVCVCVCVCEYEYGSSKSANQPFYSLSITHSLCSHFSRS